MTGIDSTLGSVLSNRIDSLIENVGAGARTAATQTGASAETGTAGVASASTVTPAQAPPPPSAQATLSEVALTLDAISRFGGEATPAVLGELPIWPAPPAIDATPAAGAELFSAGSEAAADEAAAANEGAGASGRAAAWGSAGASDNAAVSASLATSAATSAAVLPVDALAAALEQTVAETGLFYESHLAQWLAGTYPAQALVNEPQARLDAQAEQLSLEWDTPACAADTFFGSFFGSSSDASVFSPAGAPFAGTPLPPHASAGQLPASTLAAEAGTNASVYAGARQLPGQPAAGAAADAMRAGAGAQSRAGGALPGAPGSVASSIHPATIPLVRQQLDLLATQQFRWTGEVWPGAKLDWTIEPEAERYPQGAGEHDAPDEQAWRTRLTLALPKLGTVDADLVLKGAQLVVRVQASPVGAVRLAAGGAAFGRRLQAAGIELAGLSIREVGGSEPATAAGAAQAATSAYARAAAAAAKEEAHDAAATEGATTSGMAAGMAAGVAGESRRAAPSPLDHLFDDPFDWSGT